VQGPELKLQYHKRTNKQQQKKKQKKTHKQFGYLNNKYMFCICGVRSIVRRVTLKELFQEILRGSLDSVLEGKINGVC
jgi:hypothetical protein